jgi:hypothetical protein
MPHQVIGCTLTTADRRTDGPSSHMPVIHLVCFTIVLGRYWCMAFVWRTESLGAIVYFLIG